VEDTEPTGDYTMSQLSQTILEHMVDYSLAAQRRIENYQALLEALSQFAIFREMDPGVVPLGFPVRVENRDSILRALFDQQIYPPVHWPIAGIVPPMYENSHRLAQQIMTLPCDQRYEPEDMKRIAEIFLRHANSAK
jgi:dTDP-4-amino-4,6-dideoxygalactose transaminase